MLPITSKMLKRHGLHYMTVIFFVKIAPCVCSQPDNFASVCCLVPLPAMAWRDSAFCFICFC